MPSYPVLPGYYEFLFVHLEPLSEVGPFVGSALWGPAWFYNELTPPTGPPPLDLDIRAQIGIWQLAVGYMTLFCFQMIGYRVIRNSLKHDLAAQEQMVGIFLSSLALSDFTHIVLTFLHLPDEIKYNPLIWNTTTHGNISFVGLLFVSRISWFLGIGRKRYYFGQPTVKGKGSEK